MATEPQEICETVAGWFAYKSHTGLSQLFSEASLTVPIGEYLSTKHQGEVQSEKAHPLFKKSGRGRPKQIDFVRLKRGSDIWHAAYECKLLPSTVSRIVEDICRLTCLTQASCVGTPNRYLVVAGTASRFKELRDTKINAGQNSRICAYDGVLSFSRSQPTRNKLRTLHRSQKRYFSDFAKKYEARLPSAIKTDLCGEANYERYGCWIWRISAVQGCKLLDAKEILD